MKVALIYAKSQTLRGKVANAYAEEDQTKGEYSRDEIYPPLGISTLAARLEKLGGYEVRLQDDSLDSLDELKDAMRWADVVGISSLTPNAKRARELGVICKQEIGRPTVMGGPHPTTNPEYFLEAGAADKEGSCGTAGDPGLVGSHPQQVAGRDIWARHPDDRHPPR